MARKTRRKGPRGPLDPREVLEGRWSPDIMELLSLISQVNPTDRGLPPAETQRRYSLKARLVSRLVQLFGEELDVVPEPGQEDLVLLRHRDRGVHARIGELEEEAASWVRLRRDQELYGQDTWAEPIPSGRTMRERPAPVERREPEDETSPSALIEMGLEAMGEFAYDRAWACLERALGLSKGASLAALPLLDLLVNHLGAYNDALSLAPRLSPEAAADPQACLLLGLAAAHCGQAERARRLLRGQNSPRAAEAYLVLAQRALEGDLEGAEAFLSQARHLGARPPGPGSILLPGLTQADPLPGGMGG